MATAAAMEEEKPPPGHFRVLYFADVSDFLALVSEDLPAPLPLVKLFDVLEERHPDSRERFPTLRERLDSCLVTVDLEYVDVTAEDRVISDGDVVGVIPPVSSG